MTIKADRHRDDTADHIRKDFEDIIYEHYRLGRMEQMLAGHAAKNAPLMPTAEYFARDARGDYVVNAVKLLWIGYKLFRDAATPVYYGSRMWNHWARMNDRAMAELPEGYTVSLHMMRDTEHSGCWVGLTDEEGEMVEYPNPPGLDFGPGSVFKVIEVAIDAAIAEAKRRSGSA